jgi:hypothetical protein
MKRRSSAAVACGFAATPAAAHELILRYDLPIPFDLYLIACSVALVVTFVLSGLFMRMPGGAAATAARLGVAREDTPLPHAALLALRIGGLACFALTLATAAFGSRDPDRNLSLTLFWQIFLLGVPYATALVGDVYALANPWKTIAEWLQRGRPPRWQYPAWLGYWPSIAAYVALVWLELFPHPRPALLAQALLAYSAVTLAGALAFGTGAWFRYGELFAVLLRIVGMLAPVRYRTDDDGRSWTMTLRWPFVGLVERPADRMSLVVFVLFMLSSTTYDGMHQTIFWMGLYYNHLIVALQPLWGTDLLAEQQMLEKWFSVYQRAGLVLSPFFYLAIYLGILWLVKRMTAAALPLRTLALEFAFSIVPIAFVYNVAHYYTLVLTRLPVLPYLLSDPFNLGWNPFGFAPPSAEPPVLNMAAVWHTEVALILIGHVISVYIAHRVAMRLFPTRRQAMLAQLPMLVLMVSYTVLGLWVISLPFALVSAPHHS